MDATFHAHYQNQLDHTLIQRYEYALGLTFNAEKTQGNVCFANHNDELQDAYKQVFNAVDLLDYFYAVLHSAPYQTNTIPDFTQLPLPKDTLIFWQISRLGRQLRQLQQQNAQPEKIAAILTAIDALFVHN